ncbi:M28 family peptidase [Flavobacterium sp. NST-5]|uniref:M28 family peptidase n=1 Tax=Flavobacterium ichthyis TaxID=2698827 RepID=A0ABW9ZA86_9FLAO|nr:M28 family metallopeptidase [Flavobacterium ichthyis]NBL65808.1 M28 family peptidase [Flavobacterium ichthyis]
MKKSLLSGFVLSLFLVSCSGSKNIKYVENISAENLKTHLYIVASDEMEGRNTGEPGQKKAGKYLISQYEKMGIPHPKGAESYYQAVPSKFMKRQYSPALNDSENIWAFIEGTEKPEEIVVISAHYDHVGMKNGEIYNGADDDGSGTVALLEIARVFNEAKKEGKGPKRSILFLHVTGEEHGLHGSRFYVENPIFPLKNTVVDLNIDMIGRRDDLHKNNGNYVYLIGSDRLSTDLHTISEKANEQYTKLLLDYKYNDRNDPERIYYRSDHYNFAKNGIPSLFYFNGVHEDYHKPGDTPDKIEYDLLAKRTKLVFATAWEIANRKERIKVDRNGE